jgi:hypothetical protein
VLAPEVVDAESFLDALAPHGVTYTLGSIEGAGGTSRSGSPLASQTESS